MLKEKSAVRKNSWCLVNYSFKLSDILGDCHGLSGWCLRIIHAWIKSYLLEGLLMNVEFYGHNNLLIFIFKPLHFFLFKSGYEWFDEITTFNLFFDLYYTCSYSIRGKGYSSRQNQDFERCWGNRGWVSSKNWRCHAWRL